MRRWWAQDDIINESLTKHITPKTKRQIDKIWKKLKKTHRVKTIHFGKDDNTLTVIEEKK